MTEALQRISFVEDDPDIRAITEIALIELGGFTLDVSASGAEAVLKTASFNPHLILLDVMMPGMDGIATLRKLREKSELADTPVVFMTAKAMPDEIERLLSLGAVEVIAKPFDPMTLPRRLRTIWEGVQSHSTPSAIDQSSAMDQLRSLLIDHHGRLLERVGEVGALLASAAMGGPDGEQSISKAIDLTHKISGGAGTIGFLEISRAAAELEQALTTLAALPPDIFSGQLQPSLNRFAEMEHAAKRTSPETSTLYHVDPRRFDGGGSKMQDARS
jgi:two-component system, OmpR family, response regulator